VVTPVIDLQDVGKVYSTAAGDTEALRNITFSVAPGEFVSIMGPSGSGKSTLMNIIGLLDRPTSGAYLLDGQNVNTYDEKQLAALRATSIGFVFQSFNLLPRASVLKNVILPMEYTGVPRGERLERASEALARCGLPPELYDHKSNEISGGQMQRVAIARSLVNSPSLILADEPTGNLDSRTGEAVLEMFGALNAQGVSIVLITHELFIARHASRILHIRDGELFDGAWDDTTEEGESVHTSDKADGSGDPSLQTHPSVGTDAHNRGPTEEDPQ
jgi:putative ABC transport system ATP-binding protein